VIHVDLLNSVLEEIRKHVNNKEEIVNVITINSTVVGVLPFRIKEKFTNVRFFKEMKFGKVKRYILIEETKVFIIKKENNFIREMIKRAYKNPIFYERD